MNCEAHSPGQPNGTILTEKVKGLMVLDTTSGITNHLVKITPDEGLLFVLIELGPKCAIGECIKVEAKAAGEGFWFKDQLGNAGFLTEAASHLFRESLEGLKTLGVPAKIVGSAVVDLGGVHLGLTWSGKPA